MDKRFRYLMKFVGNYRVLPQLNPETGCFPYTLDDTSIPDSYEDLYIPCKKGEIRHTYDSKYELVLVFLNKYKTAQGVIRALKSKKLDILVDEIGIDVMIYFKEKDLSTIASIVSPKTAGAKIKPFSAKNMSVVEYHIPECDLDLLAQSYGNMDKSQKLKYCKTWIKEFDEVIKKKSKKKKYDVDLERDLSGLKNKEFIHSVGLWKEYCSFIKDKSEKLND